MIPILLTQEQWPVGLELPSPSAIQFSIKTTTPLRAYSIYQGFRQFCVSRSANFDNINDPLLWSGLKNKSEKEYKPDLKDESNSVDNFSRILHRLIF